MTEILTESFCERCGTRYTFESAAPKRSRIGRVRVVSKGLRNFVMTDESSLSEAMADARGEDERTATSHQLDAFHKTFNFCLTCRQYTCGNCWNAGEGRCLTCAPQPEMEAVEAAMPEALEVAAAAPSADPVAATAEVDAWPEADLGPDRLARALGMAAVVETAPEPPTEVRGVAPGQSIEDALAAYEAQVAAQEVSDPEPQPAAVVEPVVEPEPVAVVEPEPVAVVEPVVEPEPEPEPVVEPVVEPEPVAVVEPQPAAVVEPEPVAVVEPEPEPEPVAVVEPEPVAVVEPEPAAVVEPEPGAGARGRGRAGARGRGRAGAEPWPWSSRSPWPWSSRSPWPWSSRSPWPWSSPSPSPPART